MTAPEKMFYKIGEVSRMTGLEAYVLRYWETEFSQIKPVKKTTGQRVYYEEDLKTILKIKKLLYEQKYTIAGARKKLRDLGTSKALESGQLALEPDQRARFRKIRSELQAIRAML